MPARLIFGECATREARKGELPCKNQAYLQKPTFPTKIEHRYGGRFHGRRKRPAIRLWLFLLSFEAYYVTSFQARAIQDLGDAVLFFHRVDHNRADQLIR
jgi:hypothetical protein